MAKPSSFHCNINCDYCFYLQKQDLFKSSPKQKSVYQMNDDVLRSYIKNYINSQPTPEVEFTWQGGEPTMVGLSFFEKVIAYQQQFAKGKMIRNSLQTNGILLDEKWCQFLKQHNFLVGLSIDGPEHLHNAYRVTNTGKPTFKLVMRAIELLQKHHVEFNTLTVINNINVKEPLAVYQFLKEIGSTFHQYIPVVESQNYQGVGNINTLTVNNDCSALLPFSVDASEYGDFMNSIFDEWVRNDVSQVYIQMFESALAAWAGYQSSLCIFRKTCGDALVIEQNGDIYSCDHYVYKDHLLGNIKFDKLDKLVSSKQQKRFAREKSQLSSDCQACDYQFACYGGCPKHRLLRDSEGKAHNVLCAGYKKIFAHTSPYLTYMAKQLAAGRSAYAVIQAIRSGILK